MDYKGTATTGGIDNTAPYFTPGEGVFSPAENPDLANSLNSTNYTPEHNQSQLGEAALKGHEGPASSEVAPNQEMVPLNMPPGQPQEMVAPTPMPQETGATSKFDLTTIRTEGDHIGRSALNECLKAVSDFYRGGEGPADLCDNARNMMQANLENSYGRKLGDK